MSIEFIKKRKLRKFRLKGIKVNNKKLYFGLYGLISLETGRISSKVLESFSQVLKREVKLNRGKFWCNLNSSIPVTQLSIGTRMGKGKGNIFKEVCFVRKGQILCELSLSDSSLALTILKSASSKLPVKVRIISY